MMMLMLIVPLGVMGAETIQPLEPLRTSVVTTIRIDDRKDKPGTGRITQKVQSLEAKVGKPLKR